MSDTFSKVEEVLRSEFSTYRGPVDRDTTAMDVDGWDSLAHTTFILMVERAFDVEIDPEASLDFENIGQLVDYIDKLR